MFASVDSARRYHRVVYRERPARRTPAVREHTAGYDPGAAVAARPTAAAALAQLDAALAAVAAVDWRSETDQTVNAATIAMQRSVSRVTAAALRPLEQVQQRESYGIDGAVTAPSWLRNRTQMDPAAAARTCAAARRLRGLPLLREAFETGDVSFPHVAAITAAAVPTRFESISRVEPTLVDLARTAAPRAVRKLVAAVRDIVDPDGSDLGEEPVDPDETDPRRYWRQHPTIDGMVEGSYLVDGVFGEMLSTLFDAYTTADPSGTPMRARRSHPQKRADGMRAAVRALLDAGLAPTVQGNRPHVLGMVDLLAGMDRDSAETFAAELRHTGRVSPATIARIGLDAKITPVLTMGPWRVVAVGRTHRTLPPWLRPILEMIHRRCRGPDCDRPAVWAQAHHEEDYAAGGDTDLNKTIPLCKAHHDLVTYRGWTVRLDLDTGICTWTSPGGRVLISRP